MHSLTIQNKNITVFPSTQPGKPIIYFNTFDDEGKQVYEHLKSEQCHDFTLVTISNLAWNHDMTPWAIAPVSPKVPPCTGGADNYLNVLLHKIIPETEKIIHGHPVWRGIAGYSLAGLFAVYTVYQTDVFSRVASISGSLWFPGIKEYIFSHKILKKPDRFYFSLGDREYKTRNKLMKCVQQNTENIQLYYKSQGIDTIFVQNPGGHFENAAKRIADGMMWLLNK